MMPDERRQTYRATVRIELEDVTEEVAREFWAALTGYEIALWLRPPEGHPFHGAAAARRYFASVVEVKPGLPGES